MDYDRSSWFLTQSNMPIFSNEYMRIESCRNCGTEMAPCTSCQECPVCGQALRLSCPACKKQSEIQYHMHAINVKLS
jgi:predicted RNA-binding Zn-ribbon protein involved in translation (DUF1610 family)